MKWKKILSILIVVAMVVSLVSVSVFATPQLAGAYIYKLIFRDNLGFALSGTITSDGVNEKPSENYIIDVYDQNNNKISTTIKDADIESYGYNCSIQVSVADGVAGYAKAGSQLRLVVHNKVTEELCFDSAKLLPPPKQFGAAKAPIGIFGRTTEETDLWKNIWKFNVDIYDPDFGDFDEDDDGDGFTNLDEYMRGTDPTSTGALDLCNTTKFNITDANDDYYKVTFNYDFGHVYSVRLIEGNTVVGKDGTDLEMFRDLGDLSLDCFIYDPDAYGDSAQVYVEKPDLENYCIGLAIDGQLLDYKNVHTKHSFTYLASENVISASCKEGCTSEYDTKPLTLTLTAPEDLTYDSKAKEISFAEGEADKWYELIGSDAPQIMCYLEDGSTLTYAGTGDAGKAPTDTGKYVAKTTFDTDKTAILEFEITKAQMTDKMIIASDYEAAYDGKAHTISVTGPKDAEIMYSSDNITYDSVAPTFTDITSATPVYFKVSGVANYNEYSGSKTVTITPCKLTEATVENQVYTGEPLTPIVSAKGGALTATFDVGTWDGNLIDAGTYTAKVTGNGNFGGEVIASFEIDKADAEAPTIEEAVVIDYINEKLIPNNGYEIRAQIGTFNTNDLPVSFGVPYYVRKAEDANHNPSTHTILTTDIRPTAPENAPILLEKTDTAISVKAINGQEYSIDGGKTWLCDEDDGKKDGKITFEGLAENTAYKIVTRTKAVAKGDEKKYASENSTASVITTKCTELNKESFNMVDIIDGVIKSDDSVVTVNDVSGEDIPDEKREKVVEKINSVLNNTSTKIFDNSGIYEATKDKNSVIINALKASTTDSVAKNNVTEADITKYLDIKLDSAIVDTANDITVKSFIFKVTPVATIAVTGSDGEAELSTAITNDEIKGPVTFLLPVDKAVSVETASVYHDGKFIGIYEIKTDEDGEKNIEIITKSFGKFSYVIIDDTNVAAKIGDVFYISFSDAIEDVKDEQTITLLNNASGNINISRAVKFTVDANGYTNDATISAGSGYAISNSNDIYTVRLLRSSGGGGGGVSSYTVKFETNGGNTLKNVSVRAGQTIGTIETPKKEGFVFDGWYQDKELTKPFNADDKVTKSTTLYAGWKVDPVRQITLTIGKKEATVFTEEKVNDVAPKIVNDRTMLPIRFVAEALGATVDWDGEKQLVTISAENLKIEITIGESLAFVNGNEVILDSPAFVENDRTYLPLRFVAENLGAKVEWLEATQQVVITK